MPNAGRALYRRRRRRCGRGVDPRRGRADIRWPLYAIAVAIAVVGGSCIAYAMGLAQTGMNRTSGTLFNNARTSIVLSLSGVNDIFIVPAERTRSSNSCSRPSYGESEGSLGVQDVEMMEGRNEPRMMPSCGVRRYGRLNSDFVLPQHLHDHIRRFLTCGVWRNHQLQNARLARSRCARAPC